MISIFQLWTFHLYVATFQQHLHMEYISLRWYDIPDLVIPIKISLIEGCCQQGMYWTKGSFLVTLKSSLRKHLRLPPWLGWPLWNICVRNYHGYVPLVVNTSQFFPHSRLITGFVTKLTRRVPQVDQELLPFRSTWVHPRFKWGSCYSISSFYACFVDRCLSFCTFSFDHCVFCSFSVYGFWLPLWYLQTLLIWKMENVNILTQCLWSHHLIDSSYSQRIEPPPPD